MNTTRTARRQSRQIPPPATSPIADQFEEMPNPLDVVEHLTIPGFIRRCPHRFHLQEIIRFGDQVGKIAESLQVSYLTTIDRQLGQVRLFPVPMLTRVYQVMAAQFGWEVMGDAPALADPRASDAIRANERTRQRLESVAGTIENPVVAEAMKVVLDYLEAEARRLGGDAGKPVELRPV